jgi:two-component system alkaline phosphatase synthesis response regulator PhoP
LRENERGKMGKKILIIDDDCIIQESLQELFGALGYSVAVAADGVSGFELITRDKPDLVVADILLPRMHGIALCEKIRGNDDLKQIPIILMTGVYKDVNLRMYVHKGLADDFIEKPFREKDLLVKIQNLIGSGPEKSESQSAVPEAPASELRQKDQSGKSVDKDLDDLISWAHNNKNKK